jgi:hypothetical protein
MRRDMDARRNRIAVTTEEENSSWRYLVQIKSEPYKAAHTKMLIFPMRAWRRFTLAQSNDASPVSALVRTTLAFPDVPSESKDISFLDA